MGNQRVTQLNSMKFEGKRLPQFAFALGALAGLLSLSPVQAQASDSISCPKTLKVQMQFMVNSHDPRNDYSSKFTEGRRDLIAAVQTGQDFTYNLTLSGAPKRTCMGPDNGQNCSYSCEYVDDLTTCADKSPGTCQPGKHVLDAWPQQEGNQLNYRFFSTIRLGRTVFPVNARVAFFSENGVTVSPDAAAPELALTDLIDANQAPARTGCWEQEVPFEGIFRTCASDYSNGGDPLQPVYPDTTVTRVLGWVKSLSF